MNASGSVARWGAVLVAGILLTACLRIGSAPPAGSAVSVPSGTPAPVTATVRPSPASTLTASPTATPPPTPTVTPTVIPQPRPLTSGGCCVQPQFSADGSQIWFIDQPAPDQPSGLWGVALAGGPPFFVTDRLGVYSADGALRAYPEGGQAYIERIATGERWVAPSGGRAILFSPDGTRIAWSAANGSGALDQRRTEIWIAAADGTGAHRVTQVLGGGLSGWFPDSTRLLVSGREALGDGLWFLAALGADDGTLTPLVRGPRLRGGSLSPSGTWIAYQVQFSGDPAQDGLWVVHTDTHAVRRLDLFGAYHWRDDDRLLIVPLEWDAPGQRIVEVTAETGQERSLTDPRVTPLQIANGDWTLSPDGRSFVFVSALDQNLWALDLAP